MWFSKFTRSLILFIELFVSKIAGSGLEVRPSGVRHWGSRNKLSSHPVDERDMLKERRKSLSASPQLGIPAVATRERRGSYAAPTTSSSPSSIPGNCSPVPVGSPEVRRERRSSLVHRYHLSSFPFSGFYKQIKLFLLS